LEGSKFPKSVLNYSPRDDPEGPGEIYEVKQWSEEEGENLNLYK